MFLKKKPSQYLSDIKELVECERINQDLKQTELAKLSGVSYGTYIKFVQTNNISLDRLIALFITLKLTDKLDDLIKKNVYQTREQIKQIEKINNQSRKRVK